MYGRFCVSQEREGDFPSSFIIQSVFLDKNPSNYPFLILKSLNLSKSLVSVQVHIVLHQTFLSSVQALISPLVASSHTHSLSSENLTWYQSQVHQNLVPASAYTSQV